MTGGPSAGPASAYPTFNRPASICLSELNDVFVPGLMAGTLPGCAAAVLPIVASGVAARVMAAAPRSRRRPWLIVSVIACSPFGLGTIVTSSEQTPRTFEDAVQNFGN